MVVLSMLHEGHGRNIYIVFMYLKHIPASCFYDALTRSNRRSKRGWKLTRSETYVLLRVFLPSPYRLSFLSVLFPQRERWRRRWVRAAQRGGGGGGGVSYNISGGHGGPPGPAAARASGEACFFFLPVKAAPWAFQRPVWHSSHGGCATCGWAGNPRRLPPIRRVASGRICVQL
jgi:hypothetical protein